MTPRDEAVVQNFYAPSHDATGKVDLMRYTNNGLAYGYNTEKDVFYVCETPVMSASIRRIIAVCKTFAKARGLLLKFRNNMYQY